MADAPEYPLLPKHLMFVDQSDDNTFGEMAEHAWSSDFADELRLNAPMFTAGQMRAYVDADRTARATPSPPVAAPPATPVAPDLRLPAERDRAVLLDGTLGFTVEMVQAIVAADRANRLHTAAQPQPQPAQPLTGTAAKVRAPLSDAQIEKLREATFSTNNPFCPCDSKTMRKAVWAAERAHGITAPSTPTPPEVAP